MFKAFLIFLFLSLLTFTRVYNLDRTARFIWDESSDLVRMHQFFVERKITLIGPIDETGTKIFSSLTYYMLMPFAILGNFDPVSPVFGSAFWGILTAVLIIYLTYLINKKFVLVTALLVLVWFPLVETSRWAWNPNLIPFWATLGILFFQFKGKLKMFVAGIFLGFTIHSHYLSLFALSGFIGSLIIFSFKEKIFKNVVWIITGIVVTLVPFVIFDLRHPPGLFLTRIMFFSPSAGSESLVAALIKLK
ncbi:hypothetical protein HYW43_03250, partial [Candidatus Daviesbacteria bacterium]|nr:hypothetical protein [Candidatus Daviesbacteria bacterium]